MNMMEKRQVDSLVVVDDDNQIEGYVSIYDVSKEFDNENKQVKDIVQPFTHRTNPDALLSDAVHILDESKSSYIPVVSADDTLAGLLTRGSIVGHMREIYS